MVLSKRQRIIYSTYNNITCQFNSTSWFNQKCPGYGCFLLEETFEKHSSSFEICCESFVDERRFAASCGNYQTAELRSYIVIRRVHRSLLGETKSYARFTPNS